MIKVDVVELAKAPKSGDVVEFVTKADVPFEGVAEAEFSGAANSSVLLRDGTKKAVNRRLAVGLGEKEKVTTDTLRQAAGVAVRQLLKIGATEIAFDAIEHAAHAQAIVEGAVLASYEFEDYKAADARRKNALERIVLIVGKPGATAARKAANAGSVLAEAANLTRAVGNLPGNDLFPASLNDYARDIARKNNLKITSWDEKRLAREGFGGILAVGEGSARPPRMIQLEYKPAGLSAAKLKAGPVVIVGKAVTFDTGGISLKPGERMAEMKWDKMGGVAVLGIMQAVAQLKLPIHIIGLIGSAENMPSASAYRPGDIVTPYDGQTIEILNTDAEGRVVLADCLGYAVNKLKPRYMIDLATLTGACVVALGEGCIGLFSEDNELSSALLEAGSPDAAGERIWQLPLGETYSEQVKSSCAVVRNTGGTRWGGASTAAAFLQVYARETRWAHLDIAGAAWLTADKPHLAQGATASGVRLVVDAIQRLG